MSDKNWYEEELNEEQENNTVDQNQNQNGELTELESLELELKNQKEAYLRLFAEFDNFKKRTAKERLDIFKTANSETLSSLLPVLDDFERATKEIGKSGDNELLKGIELIQNKLVETLRAKGLKKIEVEAGDDFDVDLMEAVAQIPTPEKDLKGKIIDVVQTGYELSDKVLRHAKVVVGQ